MVSDLIQLRRDQVPRLASAKCKILPQIGRDRALEELVDVQIPDPDRATSPAADLQIVFQVGIPRGLDSKA